MVEVAALFLGWLTPTSLFVLLNVVIATILISSAFGSRQTPAGDTAAPSHLQFTRPPSLLSRVVSFNFNNTHLSYHHYETDEPDPNLAPPTVVRAPSFLSRVTSFNFSGPTQPDPVQTPTSETETENTEHQAKHASVGVTRSPSLLSRVASFSIPDLPRSDPAQPTSAAQQESRAGEKKKKEARAVPVPVPVPSRETTAFRCDEEVDAKADDFINNFKKQLKMQRLESLLRYRN